MKKQLATWIALALVGYGLALLFAIADAGEKPDRITAEGIQRLVDDGQHAQYTVMQYKDGRKDLKVTVVDEHGRKKLSVPLDEAVTAILTKNNISCYQSIEGKNFHKWGLFGRLLPFVFVAVILAGLVTLVRLPKMK